MPGQCKAACWLTSWNPRVAVLRASWLWCPHLVSGVRCCPPSLNAPQHSAPFCHEQGCLATQLLDHPLWLPAGSWGGTKSWVLQRQGLGLMALVSFPSSRSHTSPQSLTLFLHHSRVCTDLRHGLLPENSNVGYGNVPARCVCGGREGRPYVATDTGEV